MSAAQNRFKQARAPEGLKAAACKASAAASAANNVGAMQS